MESLNIIGNVCNEPETRTVGNGSQICTFTVAVNQRKRGTTEQQDSHFYRVSAWYSREGKGLGSICQQYIHKGSKVFVNGIPSAHAFTAKDGSVKASLEVMAQDVEFLSTKNANGSNGGFTANTEVSEQTGFTPVSEEGLPF